MSKNPLAGGILETEPTAAASEAWAPAGESEQTETPAENADSDGVFMLDISGLTYANIGPIDTGNLELLFGELLSVNYGGDGVVIVKGKITPFIGRVKKSV